MRILVVEDDVLVQEAFQLVFKDHSLHVVASGEEAVEKLTQLPYNILFLDIKLKGALSGIDVLKTARQIDPLLPIVMMSGLEDRKTIVECIEGGAVDYFVKGSVNPSVYKHVLHKASVWRTQQAQRLSHKQVTERDMEDSFDLIKGSSESTRALRENISLVGTTDGPFLICGETGTGKELVARSIWRAFGDNKRPFITVNCAELQSSTIEGELFGYEKGAFTGANQQKVGLFEAAHGGDIFLDEIGELPIEFQSKLLRVIQEKKVRRMGSTIERQFDFRVIAATNRNLPQEVRDGNFRQDLFYRLDVHALKVAPLRSRTEDILELLNFHFVENGVHGLQIELSVQEQIAGHQWPGNVRQLFGMVKHLLPMIDPVNPVLSSSEWASWLQKSEIQEKFELKAGDLRVELARLVRDGGFRYDHFSEETRRSFIETALEMSGNNRTAAARLLGVSRQRLGNWLIELGWTA